MAWGTFTGPIAIIILIVTAYASAAPVQDGPNLPQRNEYGSPPLPNLWAKYFEDRGMEPRNSDNGLGRPSLRQIHRGLDSLSGATFGESKRFLPLRRSVWQTNIRPGNFDEIDRSVFDHFAKRNIDEIDRTAFDSFFKRNFDEIDRVGWSGFVKKLDNYLANKERR